MKSQTTPTLDGQKVHILLLPIVLCVNYFVGGFLLAAYGEQIISMVAKGAGRFNPFLEHARCSEVGCFSGVRYGGLHCIIYLVPFTFVDPTRSLCVKEKGGRDGPIHQYHTPGLVFIIVHYTRLDRVEARARFATSVLSSKTAS